jgi:serine/threonine protein kinase
VIAAALRHTALKTTTMIGKTVSHYRIIEKLGEGGMGIVYLAEDTHLGRRVAIKFLASTQNHNYRARFLREARAVSNLSHPHIAVLHDYGETEEGQPFIVMEYLKGKTLSDLLNERGLTLTQALEITEAVADALSAAHRNGIVHRDIKPSNVIVDEDGRVKVVDFGLVKHLNEEATQTAHPDAATLPAMRTSSNVVVGTPLYLSPEQAMGLAVDARSDIFALGALLYESLTGKPAFAGGSVIEIGAQIIHFNPPAPSSINHRVPPELDRITQKALQKKADQRYQSATEFLGDLRAVHATLSDTYHLTKRMHVSKSMQSSALKSISDSLRRPRVSLGVFAIGIIAVAIALWLAFKILYKPTLSPFQTMKVTKLTNTGVSKDAAISPNGQYAVYVTRENGRDSLWLRHLATGTNTAIIPPSEEEFAGLTFSPDSNYVYYVRRRDESGSLFKIAVLGGNSQRLIGSVDSRVSMSPDGNWIAFVRLLKTQGEYDLIVARSDGSDERKLASRTGGDFFSLYRSTAWSPDGKTIACASGSFSGGYHMNLNAIKVDDGTEKEIPSQSWYQITHIAWPRDGRGLLVVGSDQAVVPFQLWYVSYPDGSVRRITNDSIDYYSLTATSDSHTLVTMQVDRLTTIWTMARDHMDDAQQLSSGVGHTNGVSWTPDNKLLYSLITGADLNIWRMSTEGGEKIQLTSNMRVNYHAMTSSDGRRIVFASNRAGPFNIWIMDADGGNVRQLTSGGTDFHPCFSPDGKWVVYESYRNGVPMLWKVSSEGGAATQLTRFYSSFPAFSPDGKTVACRFFDEKIGAQSVALIGFDDSRFISALPIEVHQWQRLRWTPDGSAITYVKVRNGVANIWSQPIVGGQPKQLTDFKTELIFSYDWSRDGQQLACERGIETSDAVLISDYSQ